MPDILVIDDEPQIQKLLEITLNAHGYGVLKALASGQGLSAAAKHQPDLIILDLDLPDESGFITLQKLREWSSKPVIILSVYSQEDHIVKALDHGANDYLVKPFRTGELLARIRSALRSTVVEEDYPLIQFKEFEMNLASRTVRVSEESLKLTATQYALLLLFVKNQGRVLTHQYILREVWGPEYKEELPYLRVFIAQLRKKIEKDINQPKFILTESGIGYRFVADER